MTNETDSLQAQIDALTQRVGALERLTFGQIPLGPPRQKGRPLLTKAQSAAIRESIEAIECPTCFQPMDSCDCAPGPGDLTA